MRNSRYSYIIAVRVILIVITAFALVWLYLNMDRPATTILALVLFVIQTISLIVYHNRMLHELTNFLVFLQENDSTLAFSGNRIERSFKGLTEQLDKINQKLQSARLETERQFQYLQAVVKQIDTGIISYEPDGKVEIFNQAARDLLGIHSLKNIQRLLEFHPELSEYLISGKRNSSLPVKIKTNGIERLLTVKAGSLKFDNRVIQLVSFQNIKPELEKGELDAWRKLIRIQRHEIINSITPIATLTTAIKRRLKRGEVRKKLQEITDEQIEDTLNSLEVIADRSQGLIDFVERFRNLTDLPVLKIKEFQLIKLLDQLAILFSKELNSKGINLKVFLEPANISLKADEKLLEQVLINLVKNALEAIHHNAGEITIKAHRNTHNDNIIQVMDNGTGMEETVLESIFVPSYTTKEYGSGLGLSISRQIIQLHNGTIRVRSSPGIETVFEIVLPEN